MRVLLVTAFDGWFWLLLRNTVNITATKNNLSCSYSHYLMLRKDFFKLLDGECIIYIIILGYDDRVITNQKIGI
tara:strand:+ start:105 stop:326 length:222 start_codon:yes stop_codon:yes gene_type:complete